MTKQCEKNRKKMNIQIMKNDMEENEETHKPTNTHTHPTHTLTDNDTQKR